MLRRIGWLLLALLPVLASACSASTQADRGAGPRSWIDSPLQGSSLPLGPLDVISRARHPGGVAQIELWVNGAVVARSDNADPEGTLFVADQVWQPSAPGDYVLQVRAKSTAGAWGAFARVDVHVEDTPLMASVAEPSPTASPTATATRTRTPTPTCTPTAAPAPTETPVPTATPVPQRGPSATPLPPTPTDTPVVVAVPSVVGPNAGISAPTYSTGTFYSGACGPQEVTIDVTPLSGQNVASVRMYFALADKSSGAMTGWTSVDMARAGAKFTRTVSAAEVPGSGAYARAWFQFYFVVTDSQGRQSKSVAYYTAVTLSRCG